jgi:hypothetical protein
MENLGAFLAGIFIFLTYMLFLLRMIYKQHEIQKKNETRIIHISKANDADGKIAS